MQPPILTLDENTLKDEIRGLVRGTVEEVVNGILDAQADELASAERYERTDERQAHRSGHYSRGLPAQAGKIEAGVPKLRGARLATEVIERYRRRESSVEEALMGTCPPGVSTRNVEDVTRALWDEGLSAGTAPNPDQEASEKVDAWRRPLASERPYAFADGAHTRSSWRGAHEGVAVLVAIGADPDGRREAVGVEEGHGESEDSWRDSLGEAAPLSLRHSALEAFQAVRSSPATNSATKIPNQSFQALRSVTSQNSSQPIWPADILPPIAGRCELQKTENHSHSFTCVCRDANPVDSRLVVSLGHLATESRRVSSRRSLGRIRVRPISDTPQRTPSAFRTE
ncbi:transposase [Atopobiaceae bacterium HCP3S3_F7]